MNEWVSHLPGFCAEAALLSPRRGFYGSQLSYGTGQQVILSQFGRFGGPQPGERVGLTQAEFCADRQQLCRQGVQWGCNQYQQRCASDCSTLMRQCQQGNSYSCTTYTNGPCGDSTRQAMGGWHP